MKDLIQKETVRYIYDRILLRANNNYQISNYNEALRDIEIAAKWAYNLNAFFSDEKTENFLKRIGDDCLEKKVIVGHNKRFVLLDTAGLDNRGLTQQYIRALEFNQFDYLFITLRSDISPLEETIAEVISSSHGHVLTFEGKNNLSLLEKAEIVKEAIVDFHASRVLLHLMPWDVVSLLAVHAITGLLTYNINLTDHAFWLGSSFINYNIEFRAYGKTVSIQKRNLDTNKILELPYYPIKPKQSKFDGFPEIPNGSVVVFTGGAPYKMSDKDNTFFLKIVDGILGISPKVIVFVAGFALNDVAFEEKTKGMKYRERIYNIGIRKDVDEVYKHCDIYLQTYPFHGGLMTQYAVKNKIPVLSFIQKEEKEALEEIVNHFGKAIKCYDDFDSFIVYAKQLIDNPVFRVSEGEKLSSVMMDEKRFNELFPDVILQNRVLFNWPTIEIDYDTFSQKYLMWENSQGHKGIKFLINHYGGLHCLCLFPKCWRILVHFIDIQMIMYETKMWILNVYKNRNQ